MPERFYGKGVHPLTRPAALRWVLLVGVAFALIGMHNLAATNPMHDVMRLEPVASASMPVADPSCCADHATAPGHDSGTGHDWLHLCLAVLGQIAGAVLMLLLVVGVTRWVRDRGLPRPAAVARAPDRPPGNGRTILTSVCVLRL